VFAQPAPTPQLVEQKRIEVILNDTADDLELGAKVRTMVEKQNAKRAKKDAGNSEHDYSLDAMCWGLAFIAILGMVQWLIHKRYEKD
jgi:hypothetical protein